MSLLRWTYEHSDAVVEGSRAKYEEMERRADELARGAPVLLSDDHEDEGPHTCIGVKTSGKPCSREVDGPNEYCWQHAPD